MSEKVIKIEVELNENDVIIIPKNRRLAPTVFFDNEMNEAIESIDYNYYTSDGFEGEKNEFKITVGNKEKEIFEYKGFKLF